MNKQLAISQMSPALLAGFTKWDKMMADNKLSYILTCVARTYKEQVAIYAQGRESYEHVNQYRAIAGMSPMTFDKTEYAKAITKPGNNKFTISWTMNSKHIVNPDDMRLDNDKSNAFDFAVITHGILTYDIKANTNDNQINDYIEAGGYAVQVGLRSGKDFKNAKGQPKPDYPHIEVVS